MNAQRRKWIVGITVLLLGISVPELFNYLFSISNSGINEFSNHPMLRIAFYCFTILLEFFALTYLEVLSASDKIDTISGKIDDLVPRFSQSIGEQFSAEHTLMKIPLESSESLGYIKEINALHEKITRSNKKVKSAIPFALKILTKGTSSLRKYFNSANGSFGGFYSMSEIIDLYKSLVDNCVAMTIIEPDCPVDCNEKYTIDYITFIENLNKKTLKKYIFLDNDNGHVKTQKWLNNNGFSDIFFKSKDNLLKNLQIERRWLNYSHLLFKFKGDEYLSCSVLPVFGIVKDQSDQTIAGDFSHQNFKSATDIYLAFRSSKKGDEITGDGLVKFLMNLELSTVKKKKC